MSKRVVAIIEDDPSMRKSLARLLTLRGFVCETCGSAEEFLDHFTTSNAICVLSDINLGSGLSGIELCKRLRKSGRSLTIVLMTAFDNQQNEKRAIEAGCDAYLHKPFSSHALIDAIKARAA
jgi:DNA-binding response OmpR family regulator